MTDQSDKLPTKDALELEKLRLENVNLSRRLSWFGELLEWIKAASVAAALIGILVTFVIGTNQSKQAEETRTSEIVDKALTRMAESSPQVKLSGIAGLHTVLDIGTTEDRRSVLQFLLLDIAAEHNSVIRETIESIFRNLSQSTIPKETLNAVLQTAIDQDRALFQTYFMDSSKLSAARRREILAKNLQQSNDSVVGVSDLQLLEKQTFDNVLELAKMPSNPFEFSIPAVDLSVDDTIERLRSLARIVTVLTRLGATANDYSKIFCQQCDFRAALKLEGRFDDSMLDGANFYGMDLRKASFASASLANADLRFANLQGVTISSPDKLFVWRDRGAAAYDNLWPKLLCADLRGANLTDFLALLIVRTYIYSGAKTNGAKTLVSYKVLMPGLGNALYDSVTNASDLFILVVTKTDKEYWENANPLERDELTSHFTSSDAGSEHLALGSSFPSFDYFDQKGEFGTSEMHYMLGRADFFSMNHKKSVAKPSSSLVEVISRAWAQSGMRKIDGVKSPLAEVIRQYGQIPDVGLNLDSSLNSIVSESYCIANKDKF